MFDINQHRHEYFYNLATVIRGLIPDDLCDALAARVNNIAEVQGADAACNYVVFKGDDIRRYLPELIAIYHSLVPLISLITHTDTVVSPHAQSDIHIKAWPPGCGLPGMDDESQGITVLLFLTTNREGPQCMEVERFHPRQEKPWIEQRRIFATKGSLLLMQSRNALHHSEPTLTEQKLSVVYNYYERHDTYRHNNSARLINPGVRSVLPL